MSVSALSSTSIHVQWGPVPCIDQNGDITGYSVRYGSETQFVAGDSVTEVTISNLAPSTTYNVRVAAANNAGTGTFSNSNFVVTLGKVAYVIEKHFLYLSSCQLKHQTYQLGI